MHDAVPSRKPTYLWNLYYKVLIYLLLHVYITQQEHLLGKGRSMIPTPGTVVVSEITDVHPIFHRDPGSIKREVKGHTPTLIIKEVDEQGTCT